MRYPRYLLLVSLDTSREFPPIPLRPYLYTSGRGRGASDTNETKATDRG
ncbi:hypothetical protein HMPREF9134_01566 [Porphyromonas catoniae F0037]|uniref:Uncharacterized protein n=1 Tax=Porphyromonas catoniae F0037 TaxID=1127696 RepID=L1NAC8_9PORP|nr:hypothetical protein HMPREF9134_01566 [Porphyromonas catoniae F0037]